MTQNADEQCKVLMRDRNAKMDLEATGGLEKVCLAIVCKSSRR